MTKHNRRMTLEFKTKAERDLWKRWYEREGTKGFWGWMLNSGKRWRREAEKKLDNWPKDNEKWVE